MSKTFTIKAQKREKRFNITPLKIAATKPYLYAMTGAYHMHNIAPMLAKNSFRLATRAYNLKFFFTK